eukprot:2681726-Amphidinium_carterae.2
MELSQESPATKQNFTLAALLVGTVLTPLLPNPPCVSKKPEKPRKNDKLDKKRGVWLAKGGFVPSRVSLGGLTYQSPNVRARFQAFGVGD